MNMSIRLFNNLKILKKNKEENTVYESLKESLKEVQLMKKGKLKTKTWDELYEELKKEKR